MPLIGTKMLPMPDHFGEMVRRGHILVDKSIFIKEFWEGDIISSIALPRQFGKSLTLSMVQHFFAKTVNGLETKRLFDGFKIAEIDEGAFLKQHQGQHPVIWVSFKYINGTSYEQVYEQFKLLFQDVYRQHEALLHSEELSEYGKADFRVYLEGKANAAEMQWALKWLSAFLYEAYNNKRVIILIDAYDEPLHIAYKYGFSDQLTRFMGSMLSTALDGNSYIARGLVVGVLPVLLSGISTHVDKIQDYGVRYMPYQNCFGFTESEVEELAKKQGVEKDLVKIKSFYHGYKVGVDSDVVYNPFSIMQYLQHQQLEPYWVNLVSDEWLKRILLDSTHATHEFADLVIKQFVQVEVERNVLTYEDLIRNPSSLWTLLLTKGYLTIESEEVAIDCIYKLRIPNQEVREKFKQIFSDNLADMLGGEANRRLLIDNLTQGNVEAFTQQIGEAMVADMKQKKRTRDEDDRDASLPGPSIGKKPKQ